MRYALVHAARMRGRYSLLVTMLALIFYTMLALLDSHLSASRDVLFPDAVLSIIFLSCLISAFLCARLIVPEEVPLLETLASQPIPLQWQILNQFGIVYGVLNLTTAFFLAICSQLFSQSEGLLLPAIAAAAAASLFVSGFALLMTLISRSARIGGLGAVLTVFVLFAIRVNPGALYLFNVQGVTLPISQGLWLGSRFGYTLIGLGCVVTSLRVTENTTRLLLGTPTRIQRKPHQRMTPAGKLSQRTHPLYLISLYEARRYLRHNLLIVTNIAILLFTLLLFGYNFLNNGLYSLLPYSILSTYATAVGVLQAFALVVIMSEELNSDATVQPVVFTVIAPGMYLLLKLVGAYLATLGLLTICSGIVFIMVILLSLLTAPGTLIVFVSAVAGLWLFGFIPMVIYVIGLTLLVSAITPTRPWSRLLLALLVVAVMLIMGNDVIGNVLFPSGYMGVRTSLDWLVETAQLPLHYLTPPQPLVDAKVLWLPLVSSIIQVTVGWVLLKSIYERRVRTT